MPGKSRAQRLSSGLKYWLEGIGLGHYGELFARHCIDLDVVPDLLSRIWRSSGTAWGSQTAPARDDVARPCRISE